MPETAEPYDLPFPDQSAAPPGVRDRRRPAPRLAAPGSRRSLAELLEAEDPTRTRRTRTRPGSRTMTLTINDTTMTSDQTAHTARQAPDRQHLLGSVLAARPGPGPQQRHHRHDPRRPPPAKLT